VSEETDSVIRERFERYVEAYRSGHGDPDPAMEGLGEGERLRLGRMIDEYLESAPRPDIALSSPDDPEIQEIVTAIVPLLDGRSGGLSRLLVKRRHELELSQGEVIESLAAEFEASEPETGKIDAYYHDLEWGSLPAAGLTDRLLDSLAKILRTTRGNLREAGRALGPGRAGTTGPVFARNAGEIGEAAGPGMTSPAGYGRRASSPPDRIDDLFTGG